MKITIEHDTGEITTLENIKQFVVVADEKQVYKCSPKFLFFSYFCLMKENLKNMELCDLAGVTNE